MLGIGLVVDDAIIVVENVNRHLEEGMTPIDAAIAAARELGGPIIAMTVVLAAVYVPIGFQSGLTGALFCRIRLCPGRRRHGLGHRRADAVADAVLAAVEGARSSRMAAGRRG